MTTSPQESAPDETTDPQETDPPRPDPADDPTVEPADEPVEGDSGTDSPFGEVGSREGAEFQQGTAGAEPLFSEVDREGF